MSTINRRDFLRFSAMGIGTVVLSSGLMGCSSDDDGIAVSYQHGVASGDPTSSSVILWTRVTPVTDGKIKVSWEVATDEKFQDVVNNGTTSTNSARDYTVKIDAVNLDEGKQYYYRFRSSGAYSPVGKSKTLPTNSVSQVKLAVMSCANYPAGYFHAYANAAQVPELDAVVHLGDYIYEYGRDGYAAEDAAAMAREVLPAHEIVSLADYRTRYAQYRTDTGLQALHAHAPFICVWDDHEVANDTWLAGAENHQNDEGDFTARKFAALQAYFEWLPVRPVDVELDGFSDVIYRNFEFGNLVNLIMLDTRLVGRDQQLDYSHYVDAATGEFNAANFTADVSSHSRSLLGGQQLNWLQDQLRLNEAQWQVLGQQVLMGKMMLPGAIATNQMSIPEFSELGALATLAGKVQAGDTSVTAQELGYLQANAHKLTPEKIALLQLPTMPYNLDAWDGYAYEREKIFTTVKQQDAKLVVLAGDTHNAWANDLTCQEGEAVGVEFATASVSSPGLERYLGVAPEQVAATENGIVGLIDNLKFMNMSDRGYLLVTFTQNDVNADWVFVSDVKAKEYSLLSTAKNLNVVSKSMSIADPSA